MEERQRELQLELQHQKELVHEMQQKMALAMAENVPNQQKANVEELPSRRQWSTPKQVPAYVLQSTDLSDRLVDGFSLDAVKHRRNTRQIKTPQVPDDAFVSRPKIRNSLDVSNLSELFAGEKDALSRGDTNQSFVETSFAGNSKLVNVNVREGDPLDKTWLPIM